MGIDIGVKNVVEYIIKNPIILVGGLGIYIVAYIVAVTFFGKKKGKNPLAENHRRPHQPFVHDAKARDAVLKQRFKPSKIPDDLDVIVIGSGIGGLSTAALCGRAGKKVLVLEQHDQAGGCCHSFVEKGFEFDTGIHYIGNMHDGSINRTLLDQLTNGQLRWARMDDVFDTVVVGEGEKTKKFPMKSGRERFRQNLKELFPNDTEAIDKYVDLIKDASNSLLGFVLLKMLPRSVSRFLVATGLYKLVGACYKKGYVSRTLQQVLDSITSNKELQLVLSYICGDYGEAPSEAPFVIHAAIAHHFVEGSYYPKAGTSEVAFHCIQTIENCGGRVLMQAPVSEILCNASGRAIGVRVGGKFETDIHAKHIVSDAGLDNTMKHLLPEKVAKRSELYSVLEKRSVEPSCSFLTGFFGIEGDPKDLKLPAGNFWIYKTGDISKCLNDFFMADKEDVEDFPIPFAYISFPCAKDTEWSGKYTDKSTVLILTLAKYEWFEEWKNEKLRGRGERYEGIKDSIGRKLWAICLENFPQLDGKCVYTEVGTPVTNQYYLGFQQGEMYGLANKQKRFSAEVAAKLRADTDVPGLYLTGQDILTCGFTAALTAGVMTSSAILNRNVYFDLQAMNKKERAELKLNKAATNGHTKKSN